MADPVYFDHHATTPCDPRVVERMLPFFTETFGNPASLTHAHGRKAASAVEDARISMARLLRVEPNELVFTAGATEANNIALGWLRPGDHVVVGATEHRSVLMPLRREEARGLSLTVLRPDGEGFITAERLGEVLRPSTRLVSIEGANGEVGTLQPIDELSAMCRERGILFHSDVTQALGKVPVDFAHLDLASFSAHKFYGPKGVGGLFVRRGTRVEPVILGGGQERGIRSGTVNVPAVIGMAAAMELRVAEMDEEAVRLSRIREGLRVALTGSIPGVTVNGPSQRRLPGNLNVSFSGIDAASFLVAMHRFSLSSGSACSSGQRGPSAVLMALGIPEREAMASIRIGLGRSNTEEETLLFVQDAARTVARLREISAA